MLTVIPAIICPAAALILICSKVLVVKESERIHPQRSNLLHHLFELWFMSLGSHLKMQLHNSEEFCITNYIATYSLTGYSNVAQMLT